MKTDKILEKKAYLTVLEKLAITLDELKRDTTHNYEIVGKKTEQATEWRTGELLWEDEEKTIPKYDNKWDYVPKENLTDEAHATLRAIEQIETALEKLI